MRIAYFCLRSMDPENQLNCRQNRVLIGILNDKLLDQIALLGYVGNGPVGYGGCCNESSPKSLQGVPRNGRIHFDMD